MRQHLVHGRRESRPPQKIAASGLSLRAAETAQFHDLRLSQSNGEALRALPTFVTSTNRRFTSWNCAVVLYRVAAGQPIARVDGVYGI